LNSTRRVPPVWLMGLSNTTLGFSNGIIFFLMPQLMATAHVPVLKIAAITAVSLPLLASGLYFSLPSSTCVSAAGGTQRFSPRFPAPLRLWPYSACIIFWCFRSHWSSAVLPLASPVPPSAAGLSNLAPNEHKNPLSKWMNIAIFSGTGLISAAGGEFVRRLPVIPAAILTGTIVFLPAAVFLFIPAPGPDRRLASESFVQFNREVLSLLRRREVVLVLLFLSPCSTFVLPYLLGGLGADSTPPHAPSASPGEPAHSFQDCSDVPCFL
jgi:MFS transporter, PAT family, beta-lactamase induction signal transducer AmpG